MDSLNAAVYGAKTVGIINDIFHYRKANYLLFINHFVPEFRRL